MRSRMQMWNTATQMEVHTFWMLGKKLYFETIYRVCQLVSYMWLLCGVTESWNSCFKLGNEITTGKIIFTSIFIKWKQYFRSCGILILTQKNAVVGSVNFFRSEGCYNAVLAFTKWRKTIGSGVKVTFFFQRYRLFEVSCVTAELT